LKKEYQHVADPENDVKNNNLVPGSSRSEDINQQESRNLSSTFLLTM
jgi:hypothetical protein